MTISYTSSLDPDDLFDGFHISDEISHIEMREFRIKDWDELADETPPPGPPNPTEVVSAAMLNVCNRCWSKLDGLLRCTSCSDTQKQLRANRFSLLRKSRLDRGLCPCCGAERDDADRKYCVKCRARYAELSKFNYYLKKVG